MQTSKYLLASHRDAQWGLSVTTIGYEEIGPKDEYPTRGHADGYYFDLQKGRTLSEYQLLYGTHIIRRVATDGRVIGLVSKGRTWTAVCVLAS